jgi:IS30 family transposase
MQAVKIENGSSLETLKAQKQIFSKLPIAARRSTTVDNGREHVRHAELKESLSIQTYFADPYSSWQRGTNENHNGLLRRYLPKGTSFEDLTQADLNDMIWEINNRPKKCLGFETSEEVFSFHLSVRIGSRM